MDDMTVCCDNGLINIRVGAIIRCNNKILMVGNNKVDYLYSVGGRLKFGECAEDALKREIFEELGIELEIDHLGIIHENYFYKVDDDEKKLVYEISYYYRMIPVSTEISFPVNAQDDSKREFFVWVDSEEKRRMHPSFLYKYAMEDNNNLIHLCTDERKGD